MVGTYHSAKRAFLTSGHHTAAVAQMWWIMWTKEEGWFVGLVVRAAGNLESLTEYEKNPVEGDE